MALGALVAIHANVDQHVLVGRHPLYAPRSACQENAVERMPALVLGTVHVQSADVPALVINYPILIYISLISCMYHHVICLIWGIKMIISRWRKCRILLHLIQPY